MRKAHPLLLLGLCLAPSKGIAAPQPVSFAWDSGSASDKQLTVQMVGSLSAVRFRPVHPLQLTKVELAFLGPSGPAELHVWRDNGSHQPGPPEGLLPTASGAELMPPKSIMTGASGAFVEVDLSSLALEIGPGESFHVGVKRLAGGPVLAFDAIDDAIPEAKRYSYVYAPIVIQDPGGNAANDIDCTVGCGFLPLNFLVRVQGTYHDQLGAFWFTDVTEASGLPGLGRLAMCDVDNDGDDDVVTGGQLYVNDGKGHFSDVTATAMPQSLPLNGVVCADYDNDGWLDLYGTVNSLTEHDRLLHNRGDGTFEDVSDKAGKPYDLLPTEAAAWVDIDNDSFVDLYVANYELPGDTNLGKGTNDFFWRNRGDGTFEDISAALGIRKWGGPWCGRGVSPADYDQDGDVDVFVANYRLNPDFFFRNEWPELLVTDIAPANGTQGVEKQGAYGHGIGAAWADFDGDGDLDLFVANLAHPRFISFSNKSYLLRNEGAGGGWAFTEHRETAGITYAETHSNPSAGDFDNDGDLDLAVTCVYGGREGFLFRNDGGSKDAGAWLSFTDQSYPAGWKIDGGWGSAFADIDGDGDLDYLANRTLRNDYDAASGVGGHSFFVRPIGSKQVNRAAIGARVQVKSGGRTLVRQVQGGTGTGCQDSMNLHFGLGSATTVDEVTIFWPGGFSETFGPFNSGQRVVLTEGDTTKPATAETAGSDVATQADTLQTSDVASIDTHPSSAPATTSRGASGCTSSGRVRDTKAEGLALLAFAFGLLVARRYRQPLR